MADKVVTDLVPKNSDLSVLNKETPPMVRKSRENIQQTKNSEIVDKNVNDSYILEDTEKILCGKLEKMVFYENKFSLEIKVNDSSNGEIEKSEGSSQSSIDVDKLGVVVIDKKDLKMTKDGSKDDQTKLQGIDCKSEPEKEYICTMDYGTVPLDGLLEENDDSKKWKEFLRSLQNEARDFHTIMTPKCFLDELMSKDNAFLEPTATPIDKPDLNDYEILQLSPYLGCDHNKVLGMPAPKDVIKIEPKNETKDHPVKNETKKCVKTDER